MKNKERIMAEEIITFTEDQKTKEFILKIFGKTVDAEGYIVEIDNPAQKVLTPDGEALLFEDFAGVQKGSELFIKSDLPSIFKVATRGQ
ncbi:MAG: hypothetical protein COS41_04565 [Elusimicrobia bacterium CG03_land_8_20_14_0_80_50_18]|nr:MAG: hypothetical protein COS41_04565 [Elusimicrobia bacterium CG03_land_8_20_14_0_80_50_18]